MQRKRFNIYKKKKITRLDNLFIKSYNNIIKDSKLIVQFLFRFYHLRFIFTRCHPKKKFSKSENISIQYKELERCKRNDLKFFVYKKKKRKLRVSIICSLNPNKRFHPPPSPQRIIPLWLAYSTTLAPQLEIPTVKRGGFTPLRLSRSAPILFQLSLLHPFFSVHPGRFHFDRLGRRKPLGRIDVNATSEKEKWRVFSAVKPRTPLTRALVFGRQTWCSVMAPFVTALHLFLTDKTVTHRDTIIRSFKLRFKLVSLSKFCLLYILFFPLFRLYSSKFIFEEWKYRHDWIRMNQKSKFKANVSLFYYTLYKLIFRILISFEENRVRWMIKYLEESA